MGKKIVKYIFYNFSFYICVNKVAMKNVCVGAKVWWWGLCCIRKVLSCWIYLKYVKIFSHFTEEKKNVIKKPTWLYHSKDPNTHKKENIPSYTITLYRNWKQWKNGNKKRHFNKMSYLINVMSVITFIFK